MQKRTKILEQLLAETAFEAAKSGITAEPADLLVRKILQEEGTLAHELLEAMLTPGERLELQANIEQRLLSAAALTEPNYEELFVAFRKQLCHRFSGERSLSTAHLLARIAEQPTLMADQLHRLNISSGRILRKLEHLTEPSVESPLVAHPRTTHDLDSLFEPLKPTQSTKIILNCEF